MNLPLTFFGTPARSRWPKKSHSLLRLSRSCCFHGDEALIRRLLLNLLDNAIKYTPKGGKVTLECKKQSAQYFVSVTDSGPGISPELQSRIFERFFRADKARSRSETDSGGAGLGLSIARWIAEAHHGQLELARSDTSGTTFTVTLPAPHP